MPHPCCVRLGRAPAGREPSDQDVPWALAAGGGRGRGRARRGGEPRAGQGVRGTPPKIRRETVAHDTTTRGVLRSPRRRMAIFRRGSISLSDPHHFQTLANTFSHTTPDPRQAEKSVSSEVTLTVQPSPQTLDSVAGEEDQGQCRWGRGAGDGAATAHTDLHTRIRAQGRRAHLST